MEVILDGAAISSIEDIHRQLAAQLHFPAYYGGNLSALYDCLTDISDPVVLQVRGCSLLEASLGLDIQRFFRVLEEAEENNRNLTVRLL